MKSWGRVLTLFQNQVTRDALSIVGTADIFIKMQVTGPQKKLIQCFVLRGNKQAPKILVSLERMKALQIIHETFGSQTIDHYLFNIGTNSNKYSERYMCNNIEYYQSPKIELREPTKEEKSLREKIKNKQAGAELCQAQGELKLVWALNNVWIFQFDL